MLAFLGALSVTTEAERCEETCPDDDAQGNCASDCDACLCCAHSPRPIPIAEGSSPVDAKAESPAFEVTESAVPSADPREILHVPITRLA